MLPPMFSHLRDQSPTDRPEETNTCSLVERVVVSDKEKNHEANDMTGWLFLVVGGRGETLRLGNQITINKN